MDTRTREDVRLAVHSALRRQFPELTNKPFEEWRLPGGIQLIHDHLETLIDIVQRDPEGGAAAWKREVAGRICPGCRERYASGFCVLREVKACALDNTLVVVAAAIKRRLGLSGDPDALARRASEGGSTPVD